MALAQQFGSLTRWVCALCHLRSAATVLIFTCANLPLLLMHTVCFVRWTGPALQDRTSEPSTCPPFAWDGSLTPSGMWLRGTWWTPWTLRAPRKPLPPSPKGTAPPVFPVLPLRQRLPDRGARVAAGGGGRAEGDAGVAVGGPLREEHRQLALEGLLQSFDTFMSACPRHGDKSLAVDRTWRSNLPAAPSHSAAPVMASDAAATRPHFCSWAITALCVLLMISA